MTVPEDTASIFARERAARQLVAAPSSADPAGIVRHMLAMQAQDFAGAKWAIGARSTHLNHAAIEEALEQARIVRSWPMRGTLHFLAAEDARWMISLLAHRAIRSAARRHRELEIDDAARATSTRLLERNWASTPGFRDPSFTPPWNAAASPRADNGASTFSAGPPNPASSFAVRAAASNRRLAGWIATFRLHRPNRATKPCAISPLATSWRIARRMSLIWPGGQASLCPMPAPPSCLAADTLESEQIGEVEFWRTHGSVAGPCGQFGADAAAVRRDPAGIHRPQRAG